MTEDEDHDRMVRSETVIERIERQLEAFVTKDEFWPYKALLIGLVGLVMAAFIGGVLSLLWKH